MIEFLRYSFRTTPYDSKMKITLDEFSNGLTIKNVGNSQLVFDNDVLQPNRSKAIGGNFAEILEGNKTIYFKPIENPPLGYVQVDAAIITEKFYILTPKQIEYVRAGKC